jgi:hypothetical protein
MAGGCNPVGIWVRIVSSTGPAQDQEYDPMRMHKVQEKYKYPKMTG